MGPCWSAGVGQSVEPGQGIVDHVCPGPAPGEAEDAAPSGGDELGGGGQEPQPQAEPSGFPEPGGAGEGEHRHPGEQVEGDLDDLQPDLVLRAVVQGQVAQAGGAGGADAVLGAGPPAVPQLQRCDLLAGGVGGEAGQPQPVGVGEAQLGARPSTTAHAP